MSIVLKNNASDFLAASIDSVQTTLTLQSAASFPSIGGTQYFYVTLQDTTGQIEIVKVTARSGNNFTVVRGQDGTSAASFVAGSRVELRVTVANVEGGTYTPAGLGAVSRTLQAKLRERVSVRDFGAVGDNVTNDYLALQAALNSGAKSIYLDVGHYRCDSTLTVPKDVSIYGAGTGQSVIDFSQTNSLVDFECIRTAPGTYTLLPSLSAPISISGNTMTFSSAPAVAVGDVLVIFNPTNESWSGWRTYYRAGEYVRVAKISGNTVTIEGGFADNYVASAVDVYKLTNFTSCLFSDFAVIGSTYDPTVDGLTLRNGIDCTIRNVKVTNCSYSGIQIDRCYNLNIISCVAKDDSEIVLAGDYGLLLGSSQVVQVQGGEYVSARHGVTIGGGSAVGDVPNRYLIITGAYIATVGANIQAADIHGNAEFVTYADCYIDGGIVIGGDNQTITNCNIVNATANGENNILFSELKGCNHRITNNTMINNFAAQDATRGFFIDCGGNGDVMSKGGRGGTFFISGNDMRASQPIQVGQAIYFHEVNLAYTGNQLRNIVITNNKIARPDFTSTNRTGIDFAVFIRVGAGLTAFGDVTITNNDFYGGFRVSNNNGNDRTARIVRVENNKFFEGLDCVVGTAEYVYLTNNRFQNIRYYSGVNASAANPVNYANILANDTINCSWEPTGSTTTNTDIFAQHCDIVVLNGNNTAGNFQILRTVSGATGFTLGETITGSTSGETAIVYGKPNATRISIRDSASGAFTGGETLTGSLSGHTAVLEATNYQAKGYYYHLSYVNNGTVYVDHNISYWGLTNNSSGNSSVVTTI